MYEIFFVGEEVQVRHNGASKFTHISEVKRGDLAGQKIWIRDPDMLDTDYLMDPVDPAEITVEVNGAQVTGVSDFYSKFDAGKSQAAGTAFVDDTNSSSTPLGAGQSFTGQGREAFSFSAMTVVVDTDADGTLYVEFSTDGTNWDIRKQFEIETLAASGSRHAFGIVAKYARVRYDNGSAGQTYFRLQTIFHGQRTPMLITSPNEIISRANDVQLVRIANNQNDDIARGMYSDHLHWHRFAYSADIPNAPGWADIWSYADIQAEYVFPTSASRIRIQAGDAADIAGGLGAQSVTIFYLKDDWSIGATVLATNGGTVSAWTSDNAWRFLRAKVSRAGTIKGNNIGRIIFENESGQVVGAIDPGIGITEMSHFTVPAGYVGLIKRSDVQVESNKPAEIRMWRRPEADLVAGGSYGAKQLIRRWPSVEGSPPNKVYDAPIVLEEKTDIWLEGQGSGQNTEIGVEYCITLIKGSVGLLPQ